MEKTAGKSIRDAAETSVTNGACSVTNGRVASRMANGISDVGFWISDLLRRATEFFGNSRGEGLWMAIRGNHSAAFGAMVFWTDNFSPRSLALNVGRLMPRISAACP